jgi:ATP-dependent exoDNAse (exonuclease V) beta subunit
VLSQVLDQLDRLSIGTIDGFFSRLARAFAAELGLPAEWTIASQDQDDAQRALALSRLLDAQPDAVWELVRMATDGAPKAKLHNALLTELKVPLQLLDLGEQHAVGTAPWKLLCNDGVQLFAGAKLLTASAVKDAIAALQAAPLPITGKGTPNATWVKARQKLLDAVTRGSWRDVTSNEFAGKVAAGDTFAKCLADDDLAAPVRALLSHALAIETTLIKRRIAGCLALARGFRDQAAAIRRAQGCYSFAEIASALARAHRLDGDGLQAMRYRLDCAIRDLAIDECQDTSPDQYSVLAPFMDEIFAANDDRRFIMVGDPKQSIYGWRGGTPSLIGHVAQERADGLETDVDLATSHRSHPAIMGLVNQVFGPSANQSLADRLHSIERATVDPAAAQAALADLGLPVPASLGRDPIDRVMVDWTFVQHASAERLQGKPATIAAWGCPEKDDWAAVAARVAVAASAARPEATIGILVHTNKQIGEVVHALRELGEAASDEGRGSLMDSMAVAILMALLRVADQPLDRLALLVATQERVRSALVPVLDVPEFIEPFAGDRLGQRIRQALHEHGLAAWLERIAAALSPVCGARDRVRLRQVLALAATAPADMASRPERFVHLVESTGSRTVSDDRIRVMTIHASKGLEFDEVVLPTLSQRMDKVEAGPGEWSVITDGPGGAPLVIGPVVKGALADRSPLLSALQTEARVRKLFDGLSAFYVALTRARSGVHLICQPPSKEDEADLTPLWLLRASVDGFADAYLDAFKGGSVGSAPFWGNGISSAQVAAAEATKPHDSMPRVVRPIPAVAAGGESTGGSGSTPARIRVNLPQAGSDPAAMRRGTIVHALLRQVVWADHPAAPAHGGGLDEAAISRAHELVQAELRSPVGADELAEAVHLARGALAGPVGAALARPTGAVQWSVHGELPFQRRPRPSAPVTGRLSGRMDRVVLGTDGARITHAHVIDFKTGSIGQSRDEVLEHYGEQMQDYRAAMAELTGLEPVAIQVSLLMVDRGDVIAT